MDRFGFGFFLLVGWSAAPPAEADMSNIRACVDAGRCGKVGVRYFDFVMRWQEEMEVGKSGLIIHGAWRTRIVCTIVIFLGCVALCFPRRFRRMLDCALRVFLKDFLVQTMYAHEIVAGFLVYSVFSLLSFFCFTTLFSLRFRFTHCIVFNIHRYS